MNKFLSVKPHTRFFVFLFLFILGIGISFPEASEKIALPIIQRSLWATKYPITKRMRKNAPKARSITLHHTAMIQSVKTDPKKTLNSIMRFHMDSKKWGDIAYHYLISPSGEIFEGRSPEFVADTATNYDPYEHITICLLGNFETQTPTPEALYSTTLLAAKLLFDNELSIEALHTHKDVAATACPGKNVIAWLKSTGKNNVAETLERIHSGEVVIELK